MLSQGDELCVAGGMDVSIEFKLIVCFALADAVTYFDVCLPMLQRDGLESY